MTAVTSEQRSRSQITGSATAVRHGFAGSERRAITAVASEHHSEPRIARAARRPRGTGSPEASDAP